MSSPENVIVNISNENTMENEPRQHLTEGDEPISETDEEEDAIIN